MSKILVIDDDSDMQLAIRLCLESKGYQVIEARCGDEGLRMLETRKPDLIILDVMMETFTEGFHVSLALRDPSPNATYAPYRHIPILVLTAIHTATPLQFAPDEDYLPVDAFLEKSAAPEELLAKVNELLERAGTE